MHLLIPFAFCSGEGCAQALPQLALPHLTQLLSRLAPQTAVHLLAQGERLQYSQQPAGTQVHNLDFDGAGRLVRVEQALQPAVFGQIVLNRWTGADVEQLLGKPGLIERFRTRTCWASSTSMIGIP